ncbi:hypothetical protein [Actinomadura hibisca]|uniref:hypothetical protein n=1 Tax=Actinomadura hibisca TaxID=68565 RepID=UPI00082FF9A2|nr:hypothetical protein [Actinomadura hibisca]
MSAELSPKMRRRLHDFPPLLVMFGGLLLIVQLVSGVVLAVADGPEPSPVASEPSSVASDPHTRPAKVTFVLTGDRRTADVQYDLPHGGPTRVANAVLPLRKTFVARYEDTFSASIRNLPDNGPGKVTCTVLVNDKVVQQRSDFGDSVSVLCADVRLDAKPIPGATVPAQGNGLLPGETRLTRTVPVKRYPGKGSPLAGRVTDDDPRLSYMSLGGDWSRSRQVDPQLSGYSRKQRFDSEANWEAILVSGLVDGDLVAAAPAKGRLRALAGAIQDYRQGMNFDDTARGRDVASQAIKVGGRKGWVVVREIRFVKKGVRARMDLSAVVIVDTGRPRPSYLWIDIPETHKRLWPDINTVIGSLRVT